MLAQPLSIFLDAYQGATQFVPRRIAREWRVLCPVHELDGARHTPSLAVWARPDGSVAFNCMSGTCAHRTVATALKSLGLPVSVRPTELQRMHKDSAYQALRLLKLKQAQAIYESSRDLHQGDLAEIYLHRRLRDHLRAAELKFLRTNDAGDQLIGVLCAPPTVIQGTVALRCVQQTFIESDGTAKLNRHGKKWRQLTGLLKGNGVVLGDWRADMVIGEGIETVCAAMRLLGRSFGIAALSANNMENIDPPSGVKHVWVATDNDDAGRHAAKRVANFRRSEGYDVTSVSWGKEGDDAADEWLRRQLSEEREFLEGEIK